MQDRVPLYPGRVKLTPVSGQTDVYDMVRADEPQQEGTALNKNTLLSDAAVAALGLTKEDPTPSDAFEMLSRVVTVVTLAVDGWTQDENGDYTQTATVEGATTAEDCVVQIDVKLSDADRDADKQMEVDFSGNIFNAVPGNGTVTFIANWVPNVNLQINVEVGQCRLYS